MHSLIVYQHVVCLVEEVNNWILNKVLTPSLCADIDIFFEFELLEVSISYTFQLSNDYSVTYCDSHLIFGRTDESAILVSRARSCL